MEWVKGMNQSIEYIEDHLDSEIKLERAAQLAACSVFHYQRMFAYITGVTLTEYIRRRRMTLAAFELVDKDTRIIDLALKYGYDSPTAFNRAFQGVHGVSPSRAKSEGVRLTTFPRLTFTMSIKGEAAMNYKIESKEAFRVVGYSTKEKMSMDEGLKEIPKFWQGVREQGGIGKLCGLMAGKEPTGIFGVCISEEGNSFRYLIGAPTSAPVPEGMEEYLIPAATYAVFESIGPVPDAIQSVQKRIMSEWLPSSGYQYGAAPDIEVYQEGDQSAPDYRSEVWFPIAKK